MFKQLQRLKANIGKILIGELNGLPAYFNKSHMLRTLKEGHKEGNVTIGKFTFIGPYVTMGPNAKRIGNYCSIAQGSVIGGNIHPMDALSTSAVFYAERWGKVDYTKDYEFNVKPTIVEHDVWIGSNAIIMPGVTLGTGSVVGAGAVVTKDVEPFGIVGGIPAKLIGKRFDDTEIESILLSEWWSLDFDEAFEEYKRFKQS